MAELFKVLDGIMGSDERDETLASPDDIERYAEACGESISAKEAALIQAVGLRWKEEQSEGNGEWSRMRHAAERELKNGESIIHAA